MRAGVVMAIGDATLGAYGRRDIRRGIESGRFQCDDLEVALTMLGGGIEALLRRRLLGDLPREADIIFAADSLRLLGVSREEAAAIAAEDLAEIGQFEIVQR
ncbi:MAG: hypothetical protein JRH01_24845 [Deltaproteobacteria bacterium]|nr:hypothetical protein [Deltaproteobacteria bacterium]